MGEFGMQMYTMYKYFKKIYILTTESNKKCMTTDITTTRYTIYHFKLQSKGLAGRLSIFFT